MHADQFVVELVVAAGVGQERVAVRYKHVEQVHHLMRGHTLDDGQYSFSKEPKKKLYNSYCISFCTHSLLVSFLVGHTHKKGVPTRILVELISTVYCLHVLCGVCSV